MKYYNSKEVSYSFDETINKVQEVLKEQGFGVLSDIDVQATLKKKIDVDFRKYRILGACNPPFRAPGINCRAEYRSYAPLQCCGAGN